MAKIVVIDDNNVMLDFIKTLLEFEGHTAITVSSFADILPTTRSEQPTAILLDLHLGGRSTLSMLESLKADPELQHIPIMVISGMDLHEECQLRGADDFLLKPFVPDQLLSRLDLLCH